MTWVQAITVILTVLGGQLGLLLWVQRDLGARIAHVERDLGARIAHVEHELGGRMTQLHQDLTAWQRHATDRTDRLVERLAEDGRALARLEERGQTRRS